MLKSFHLKETWMPDAFWWLLYGTCQHFKNLITNSNYKLIYTLGYLSIIIPAFYFLLYCLSFFKRSGLWSVGVFALLFSLPLLSIVTYLMVYLILPLGGITLYTKDFTFRPFIQTNINYYLQVLPLSMIFFLVKGRAIMKFEKHIIQQKYLQASINPHFLFNSLTMLIDQAKNSSREVLVENMTQLSEIMRYAVDYGDGSEGLVTVSKELYHLEALLKIFACRFPGIHVYNYHITGDRQDYLIPPLSLITIVENAFKFGEVGLYGSPLEISIVFGEKLLLFRCINIKRMINNKVRVSAGMGLNNLQSRLDHHFNGRYRIEVVDTNKTYDILLTIQP